MLNNISPNASLTSVTAGGSEDEDGTAANWQVNAFAVCANTAQRVVKTSSNDSLDKAVSALCSGGKLPTGGGGDISGGAGQVRLKQIRPFAGTYIADATEDETGLAGNWFVRAYAICATPIPGRLETRAVSPLDSTNKSVTVDCPSGTRVVGSGADASGQVLLDEVTPKADLTGVTATALEDETGFSTDWAVAATAVCANPPPGLELVTTEGDPDSDRTAGVTATCPAGKNLLGTGGDINDGSGQVALDDVRPSDSLRTTTVTGIEDETGFSGDWNVTAYAICANP